MSSCTRPITRSRAPPAATLAVPAAAVIAAPAACTLSASGMGERSGEPASGSAGRTGTKVRAREVDATSVASKAIAPSEPDPSAATNLRVEVLHRGLRMEREHRVLELVGSQAGDDVGRDQRQGVADRDLAAPDVWLQAAGRQPSLAMRIGQGREASLTDQERLSRPDGRHVGLVPTHDREADADRTVAVSGLEPQPVGLVDESLVGGRDRLLDADADPGRLVVVVLVADGLGGKAGRLECVAAADARRDEQVEVALRARHRTDARFDHDERIRRVRESVVLGDESELQLESGGHTALSFDVGRATDDPTPDRQMLVPEMAGRCAGLYPGTLATDVDPQSGHADAAWGRGECRDEFGRAQAQLLGHDRRIGLHVDDEAFEAGHPARPRGGRNALCHDGLERGDGPRQAELLLQPERTRGIGDELADPPHRPSTGRHRTSAVRASATSCAPLDPAAGRTSHTIAAASNAGSRSSRVVVVTNA